MTVTYCRYCGQHITRNHAALWVHAGTGRAECGTNGNHRKAT